MGNRKHRYQQRSYKYQDQERVPEYFVEYDDYDCYFDYYDDYSDCYSCHCWSESSRSVDSARSVDQNSSDDDDSGTTETVCDQVVDSCSEDKMYNTQNQVCNNSLLSPSSLVEVKNRYAILDEDEKEETISNSLCVEDTSNDQIAVEDESEWSVYHGKSAKRRIKIKEREIAAAYKNLPPVLDEADVALQKLEKQIWIDSWCRKRSVERWTTRSVVYEDIWIVSVEGFFRKKRKAGYGVIIRDRYGVPLVASSDVYDQGNPVSELYHELQGFNRGLDLAIKYGLRKVYLYCTLYVAFELIAYSRSFAGLEKLHGTFVGCDCDNRERNLALNMVCAGCIVSMYHLYNEGEIELLYPLIQEIVHKCSMFGDSPKFVYGATRKRYNVAADHLAKLQVKQEEMKPHEFPEELKDILYEDAHNPERMYSKLRQRW